MSENRKLVLIRHGESEWNKLNLFTGWTDVGLSETGRQEAAQAGKTLKEAGYDVTTPVLITNSAEFVDVSGETGKNVKAGEMLLSII